MMAIPSLPKLQSLPTSLPLEGAVRIELQEGVPVFRASSQVETRIQALLHKHHEQSLTTEEQQELERYAEIDDYLSWLNRVVQRHANVEPPTEVGV